MWKKFLALDTSKKLLLTVTIVWILATVLNYTLAILNMDTLAIASTYAVVSDIFRLEVLAYSGKATVENFKKISDAVNKKIEDIIG